MQALCCALALLLMCCSQGVSRTSSTCASKTPESAPPAGSAGAGISDAELSQKSPHELAQYIFEHNGCNSCHSLGEQGQVGYTAHGQQVRQQSEGCIDLLTAMTAIAQKPESQWTANDRTKSEHFGEYGCTSCHQVADGKVSLTALGAKLGNWHMSCPEVMRLLSERRQQTTH